MARILANQGLCQADSVERNPKVDAPGSVRCVDFAGLYHWYEQRTCIAYPFQLPLRMIRYLPEAGPLGFRFGE